jgi:glycerol-3-phosphate dehydrogenase
VNNTAGSETSNTPHIESNNAMQSGQPSQPYDLFIVGGGINGAGIARDASGRGLSVALCEKDDIASGTSSRSGKLVHGGLRYLEYYEFRLVREALIEREVLLESAPHIIWPMRFVLPHNKNDRPAWLVRLGLFLYDHLGGRKRLPPTRGLNLRSAPEGTPLQAQYKRGFEYSDCWVDDSRLVVLNLVDATERGATLYNRTAFTGARRHNGLWQIDLAGSNGKPVTVYAKGLVNAAGPWVNDIIDNLPAADAGESSDKRVRLVKGSHIITKKFWQGDHAYLIQNHDKRVIFVNPYEDDYALIGTTDIPHDGSADTVQADAEEIQYLIDCVNRYFASQLSTDDVVRTFSGVRPLYDDNAANPSAVTRDYVFDVNHSDNNDTPLLSIFGGKITTYRKLAEHALEKLTPFYPSMTAAWTRGAALPGGAIADADFDRFLAQQQQSYNWLDHATLHHLARHYGDRLGQVIGNATSTAQLGQQFGPCFYEAEARYLQTHEWATEPEDFLQRRSKHGLHMTAQQREAFARWCESEQAQPLSA